MKLEQSFEVKAPIEEVWAAIIDLERVMPCLPGAAITGRDEDGTYHGEFKVKLGPTSSSYRGTVLIEEADAAAHRSTMRAKGTDKRGQGGADGTIVSVLTSVEGGTRVDAVTDYTITGRLASFGRGGMLQDISDRLLDNFATCLQGELATPEPAPVEPAVAEAPQPAVAQSDPPPPAPQPSKPVGGMGLVVSVLRNRLADLLEALAKVARGA